MEQAPAAPELSVWRAEEKYLLDPLQAARLKQKLALLLTPDEFGPGGYRVKSLYFDSFHNNDYYEKEAGILRRKKVRLRIYDEGQPTAKLELKEKQGDAQQKTSLLVSRAEAEALCRGDYGVLLSHGGETALRFYTILTLGLYRPAVVIEYDRAAFTHPLFSTRLTFDSKVRSSETSLDLYDRSLPWNYVLEQEVLLEVKYNQVLPKPISRVLDRERLNRISLSKYGTGRTILNDWVF